MFFIKERSINSYSAFFGLPLLLYFIKKAELVLNRVRTIYLKPGFLFVCSFSFIATGLYY